MKNQRTRAHVLLYAGAIALAAAEAAAQPAHVVNGKVETHAAGASLEQTFKVLVTASRAPAWIGYDVPAAARQQMCCFDSTRRFGPCSGCRLESMHAFTFQASPPRVIAVEGPPRLVVLIRTEAGRVDVAHVLSPECGIDVGGLTLHWFEGVQPSQSLALLSGLVATAQDEDLWEPAVSAISLHADPTADAILVGLARRDPRQDVRSQTLFWLAQRAGDRAIATIREAIERDPELEVKQQAVFALSELPNREGVPLLIGIARTHRHPEVRRQAFFWLGESEDPRALAFFEEVLAAR
jgi:hypothetical protein